MEGGIEQVMQGREGGKKRLREASSKGEGVNYRGS